MSAGNEVDQRHLPGSKHVSGGLVLQGGRGVAF